ncbi:FtsW/RodA/SpoVE family cell cycle protein [Solibacillus sp. FSL R7-0668]|uniref:FtsW/RodA/SpoVE family cell cycle protein n=1 Tax=Solibacillus sp. FSL R7-0668 TaxID=2921688 RepID=UPI0030FACB23
MSSKQFLQQVTSYIRSKEARSHVEQELQQHIGHSTKAWVSKGYSREEAEQKAISEMGSASQLGKSLDKIHRPKWDFWLMGAVILLIASSFVPILTVDVNEVFGYDMTRYLVENKIIHIVLAMALIVGLMFVDYRKLQRFSFPIYGVATLLLAILPLISNTFRNGEAMFRIGPILIQAWTVLPLLLVAFAGFFTERKWKLWQLTGLFLLPLYLIMKLPNLAVAMLYIVVVAVLFSFSHFARKVKQTVFVVVGTINVALILYSIYAYHFLLEPYQTVRIAAFLNPDLFATSEGYMMLQIKTALARAGWFGAETIYYVPEAHTDYALIQLIQAYGYVAGVAAILVILGIALRILWHARTMPQSFGKLLVIAAVTLYSAQSLYSILMVFGFLPLTGVPLPFISYGMTPLLLNAILIGLVLSVYRRKSYMIAHKMAS